MKYNNFRLRVVDISEANKILKEIKRLNIPIIYVDRYTSILEAKMNIKDFSYYKYAIVKEQDSKILIETCWYETKFKATRYICNLNGEMEAEVKGLQCFNELQRHCYKACNAKSYHFAELNKWYDEEQGKYMCSAGPIIGYNPKYEMQELTDVYEYDLNSAYSSIMLKGIPHVNKPYFNCKIKCGQVGFIIDEELTLVEKVGCTCDVVFDLIKLNAKQVNYIIKLYNKKESAISPIDRSLAKLWLNAGIGYYQRFNPFIRSYIVHKCNQVISGLINDETVLWNTDAIFSIKRRPELALGTFIGEFKEIHIKRFIYKQNNYQIDYEIPVYRGIPKAWFKDSKFDLMNDTLPKRCNKYIYDTINNKVVRNKEY